MLGNRCIPHMVFGGQIIEQLLCPECGATSEPAINESFTHVIYATELLQYASNNKSHSFNLLLSMCLKRSSIHLPCPSLNSDRPSTCRGRSYLRAYLMNAPYTIALAIQWTSDREDDKKLSQFMSVISYRLSPAEIFSKQGIPKDSVPQYFFRGMVCYYGQHYVSVFQDCSVGRPRFLLFDDARIRVIGQWRDVLAECKRARYQPVLLLYEKDSGTHDIAHLLGSDLDYSSMNDISLSWHPIIVIALVDEFDAERLAEGSEIKS